MVPITSITCLQKVGKHKANRVHACLGDHLQMTTWYRIRQNSIFMIYTHAESARHDAYLVSHHVYQVQCMCRRTYTGHAGVARTCRTLLGLRNALGRMTGAMAASACPSLVSTEKGIPSCQPSAWGSSAVLTPESVVTCDSAW